MKTTTLNGKKVVLYDSIDEMPIANFQKYNKYLLIDAGIGSTVDDVDGHIVKIAKFIKSGDQKKAMQELQNLRQNLYMISENISPKFMSFASLVKSVDGREVDNLGNFSWFDVYDPQRIVQVTQALPQFVFSGALVFWYDLSTIYSDNSVLYTEEIKDEIVQVLTTPGIISVTGRLTINNIFERFENIYSGFSIEKIYNNYDYSGEGISSIDKQFFMYPYAGLRVEFTLTTRELCQRYVL